MLLSHPKVFPEVDNESRDGGTPRLLRGPLAGPRARDASGCARPRSARSTEGFVSPLPRRFAGLGPRRGERIRRVDDAARARLGGDGRGPWPCMEVVSRLRSISAGRSAIPGGRDGLGLLSLPPLGQRVCLRARGVARILYFVRRRSS